MVNPNTKYRFTRGVVLSEVLYFPKGFEFKTGTNGELEEGKFHPSFPVDILAIWVEDGTIEDVNVFKPKVGDRVYYIPTASYVLAGEPSESSYSFVYNDTYKARAEEGTIFRSIDDARDCARMVRELLKNYYKIKASQK